MPSARPSGAKPVLRLSSLPLSQTKLLHIAFAKPLLPILKANPANFDRHRKPFCQTAITLLKSGRATSPAIPPDVVSFHKIETSRWFKRDGVKI